VRFDAVVVLHESEATRERSLGAAGQSCELRPKT
jgi:hypothetical protein